MKEPYVIISVLHLTTGCGTLNIHGYTTGTHPDAAAAKKSILDLLEKNHARINKDIGADADKPGLPIITEQGATQDLFRLDESLIVYSIGCERFVVTFKKVKGEYGTTDDEMFTTLDAYVNSGRSGSDYERLSARICADMHRHCQSQLWRFVKKLIRAFAAGRFDERNKTAHMQAGDITEFMEANNI